MAGSTDDSSDKNQQQNNPSMMDQAKAAAAVGVVNMGLHMLREGVWGTHKDIKVDCSHYYSLFNQTCLKERKTNDEEQYCKSLFSAIKKSCS